MTYKEENLLTSAPLFLLPLTMEKHSLISAPFNSETAQRFPGLQERFEEFRKQSFDFPDEVMDDMDGEQETLAVREDTDALDGNVEGEKFLDEEDLVKEDVQMFDSTASSSEPIAPASSILIDMDSSGLRDVLKDASKGVSEGTHGDYQRYE